jgi:hypothetical protein
MAQQQLIWDLPLLDSLRVNAAIFCDADADADAETDADPDARHRIDGLVEKLELGPELSRSIPPHPLALTVPIARGPSR